MSVGDDAPDGIDGRCVGEVEREGQRAGEGAPQPEVGALLGDRGPEETKLNVTARLPK